MGKILKWVINDKGMLFGGKINIIDFLCLMFILCLSPAFFFGYKLFNRKTDIEKIMSQKTTIEIPIEEYKDLLKIKEQKQIFLTEHKRAEKYFR